MTSSATPAPPGSALAAFGAIVLDRREPEALAGFYSALTGAPVERVEPDWVQLAAPGGGPALAFQLAPDHVTPRWPDPAHPQQLHGGPPVPPLPGLRFTDRPAGVTRW